MGSKDIYVRTVDGVGVLRRTDSKNEKGKFVVRIKGQKECSNYHGIEVISAQEYIDYQPTKKPAKRGSKKNV